MKDVKEINAVVWQRLIAELAAPAPDDQAFLDRLLRVIAQASGSRQAVVFVPTAGDKGEMIVRPLAAWPSAAPDAKAKVESLIQNWEETSRAAYAAIENGQTRVFTLKANETMYDGSGDGFVVALALPVTGPQPQGSTLGSTCPGAITLVLDSKNKAAAQSAIAMGEALMGYIHLHSARGELRKVLASASALETATRLLGAINSTESFKGGAMRLVNDAARLFTAERVALGWVHGQSVRLEALSDTEHFDRRMAMARKLEAAMDECLDQDQAVLYPAPSPAGDMMLSQAIVHCHRELGAGDERMRVCSVPLRAGDEVVGVLTLEARVANDKAIDTAIVDRVQACMDLLAPVLHTRKRDDLPLHKRAVLSAKQTSAWLVGPRHTLWKIVALLALVALVSTALITKTHHVNANAELRPLEKRVISSPLEGVILRLGAGAEPGKVVQAGELLVELDSSDLELQLADAYSRRTQAEKALSQARKENRTGEAARAQAQMDAARSQVDLFKSRIERSRVLAPISGTILTGNLRDKVGAAVRVGDELLQIAPLDQMIAVARLDESDLLIGEDGRPIIQPGVLGEITTRSSPDKGFPVRVLRVVPMAQANEGHNVFEVWVSIEKSAPWMRPGMEGIVRLESGQRSLFWIGTRKIVDTVRLWWW